METITTIISFTLLIGLLISPFLIIRRLNKLNIRYKFIIYLISSILTTAVFTFTFAWWADYSDQLLLEYYGYNFDAMNYTERFGKVSTDNLEKVKSLEISIMGIGWPLKAMMSFVFYTPYLLIIYLVTYLIRKKLTR